jgi:hypothetical protein
LMRSVGGASERATMAQAMAVRVESQIEEERKLER